MSELCFVALEFNDNNAAAKWRPDFYKILNQYLKQKAGGDYQYEWVKEGYYFYYFHNIDPSKYKDQQGRLDPNKALYAVKEHYHGVGVFNPHISLCKADMNIDQIKLKFDRHLKNYIYGKYITFGKDLTNIYINFNRFGQSQQPERQKK